MPGGPASGRRLVWGIWALGLALVGVGLCAGGGVVLSGPAEHYADTERAVFLAVGLAVVALVVELAALIVAIVGLRRKVTTSTATAVTVSGLLLSILGIVGAVALGGYAFLVALIAYAAVPI